MKMQRRYQMIWVDWLEKITCMYSHYTHIVREGNGVANFITSKTPSIYTTT